jgi:hypothetical protein
MKPATPIPAGYPEFFEDIKQRIQASQVSVARAVDRELILPYWDIGQGILSRQQDLGWGDAVVEALASGLRSAFPQTPGILRSQFLEPAPDGGGTRTRLGLAHEHERELLLAWHA